MVLRGAAERPGGILYSFFLTLSWASVFRGTIVQENILLGRLRQDSKSLEPQSWGEGFEKEEGTLPNPPKGPGHFPCRCPCTAGLKAVWVGEGPDGGPDGQPVPVCFLPSQMQKACRQGAPLSPGLLPGATPYRTCFPALSSSLPRCCGRLWARWSPDKPATAHPARPPRSLCQSPTLLLSQVNSLGPHRGGPAPRVGGTCPLPCCLSTF